MVIIEALAHEEVTEDPAQIGVFRFRVKVKKTDVVDTRAIRITAFWIVLLLSIEIRRTIRLRFNTFKEDSITP